ncbi:alkaline phosphatase PhoX [Altererythrobacter sp. TH136]|uniref:alkaline phosphatase PhoX n=1 Tax=Altererythrobacter sp. TH136 TaxID=2067415 RepID=UPI001AEF568E|nr:alkaline phosphatase PhoX [Altererythrobacter sp. TH136]
MTFEMHRRTFLSATASAFAALAASGCSTVQRRSTVGYGPLVADPAGLMDLPAGFTYRVISQLGDTMSDGFTVPDAADGMGCFDLGGGKIALVRNHELMPGKDGGGVMGPAFDTTGRSLVPLPGGTTTIVLDARTLQVEKQYRSLAGTIRNCAGGTTPWGSWLTCEEAPFKADGRVANQDHGWTFEVPARAPGLVDPVPLTAMGRFNHEAACVDRATGYVYQTEDRADGLLYRFIPDVPGQLAKGGKLQALALTDGVRDTRNWDGMTVAPQSWRGVKWIDLDDVEAPADDLRNRGAAAGAALFARGEGIWMGDGEAYFTCTNGGNAKLGQIYRLDMRGERGSGGKLQLFFESTSADQFNYGDNLTVANWGDLIVCEDQYTDDVTNHLRGITPEGVAYPLALLRQQTELAGACFSPDGRTLFVNAYSPAKTLAITGPWV